jgi:phage terminase large subunit
MIAGLARKIQLAIQKAQSVGTDELPVGIALCRDTLREQENPNLKTLEDVERRVKLHEDSRDNTELQQRILKEIKNNPAKFINDWAWTYDPRRKPSTIPFNLFPKQVEYINWLSDRVEGKQSGLVAKSRDAGLSWLCVVFAVHLWLFHPGSKITFGSRKADLVDKLGDPDSIFEKFRMVLKSLPKWMLPRNYTDGWLKIINQDNGSAITGEGGRSMGRGGRSSIYFLDEFAFVDGADRVDAAVSENSEVRIYVSTPNGPGNAFAKKYFSGAYPIFRIHWTDDPRKGPEWYAIRKAQLDPVILAQEIDIDFNASIEGVTIPTAWVQAAIALSLDVSGGIRSAGLDIADEGANVNVMICRQGPIVETVEAWRDGNTTQTAYKARSLAQQEYVNVLNYDCVGVGAGVGGTLKSIDKLPFTINGVNGGDSPSDRKWDNFDGRSSKEIFRNLRAELWWLIRQRFERTYEHVNGIANHPSEDLISIPNHPELIAQLSLCLWHFNDSGQIVIESKKDMKKRGISSPDYADALIYAFAHKGDYDLGWLKNL